MRRPLRPRSRHRLPVVGLLAISVLCSAASCVPEVDTSPPSTLERPLPSTTLVPIDLDSASDADDDPVRTFTGPMLDGTRLEVRSDDPAVPFVGDEPAEILRITDLAVAADCSQLRETLEFWLGFVDDEPDEPDDEGDDEGDEVGDEVGEGDAEGPETVVTTSRRASLYARATFDAIAFIGCEETTAPDTDPAP